MKPIFAIIGITTLLSLQMKAGATGNLEITAKAYMDSLLSHDKSAMKALASAGSQAESSWDNRSQSVQRIQADKGSHPVGYRTRSCAERADKVVCDFVITSAQGESWSLVLHVAKNNGKVQDALLGR